MEWANKPREEATRENLQNLQALFPNLNLEGKIVFQPPGIVMDQVREGPIDKAQEEEAIVDERMGATHATRDS